MQHFINSSSQGPDSPVSTMSNACPRRLLGILIHSSIQALSEEDISRQLSLSLITYR